MVIVWNTQTGEELSRLKHPDQIQSMSWNYDGSQIATTCKDKKMRIFDARNGEEPLVVMVVGGAIEVGVSACVCLQA